MHVVNVHEAKTGLPRLLTRVEADEDVVVARRGHSVARLVVSNARQTTGPISSWEISSFPTFTSTRSSNLWPVEIGQTNLDCSLLVSPTRLLL